MLAFAAALVAFAASASSQAIQSGQGPFVPLGNVLTSDSSGPFEWTLLPVQANEIAAGAYARNYYKGGVTDADIVDFLVNVECLEGLFDTWGTFGRGFIGDLELGGPVPKGARQANLTEHTRKYLMEVALNEQGHALMTRHAGGKNPCPTIDFDKGFNDMMAAVYGLYPKSTVEKKFGAPFDPFKNDQNFVLSVLSLEELGATGNKGLAGLVSNPVLANAIAGLATSATAQATVERMVLYEMKDEIIEPFGETAEVVFARISAWRNMMSGDEIFDQGLTNTDPRFIAVPIDGVNMIPTDVHGLTFNRAPQQNLNIVTIGAKDGKGGFFPEGVHGKINTPTGYGKMADAKQEWPEHFKVAVQQAPEQAGDIPPPIKSADNPMPKDLPGVMQLTQPIDGVRVGTGPEGRGLQDKPKGIHFLTEGEPVAVAKASGSLSVSHGTCSSTQAYGERSCSTAEQIEMASKIMGQKECAGGRNVMKTVSDTVNDVADSVKKGFA